MFITNKLYYFFILSVNLLFVVIFSSISHDESNLIKTNIPVKIKIGKLYEDPEKYLIVAELIGKHSDKVETISIVKFQYKVTALNIFFPGSYFHSFCH